MDVVKEFTLTFDLMAKLLEGFKEKEVNTQNLTLNEWIDESSKIMDSMVCHVDTDKKIIHVDFDYDDKKLGDVAGQYICDVLMNSIRESIKCIKI